MEFTITYGYDHISKYPFMAMTDFNGSMMRGVSDKSFDEAENDLIESLKKEIINAPTIIPEPKNIIIGD